MADSRLLTLKQAAARLGVHPNTLRTHVRRGIVPGAKIGDVRRVHSHSVALGQVRGIIRELGI